MFGWHRCRQRLFPGASVSACRQDVRTFRSRTGVTWDRHHAGAGDDRLQCAQNRLDGGFPGRVCSRRQGSSGQTDQHRDLTAECR